MKQKNSWFISTNVISQNELINQPKLMDTPPLIKSTEVTTTRTYLKDKARLSVLKYNMKPGQTLTEPEVQEALLNFYYDHN